MGAFLPACLALCLNFNDLFIFNELNDPNPGPLISSYLFMVSIFLLLLRTNRFYPASLRKIWRGQMFIEFLVYQFVFEWCVVRFWYPLESTIIEGLPSFADFLNEMLQDTQLNSETIIEILKSTSVAMLFSYILSGFFLVTALHITRIIDLRVLEYSPKMFLYDIFYNLKKLYSKKTKKLFNSGKKRVQFGEDPCAFSVKLAKPNKNSCFCEDFSDEAEFCKLHSRFQD